MRSSLRRLRAFECRRSEPKEKREYRPPAVLDELVQASQDMQDMKSCYDCLLSAAAATANGAYEFSEALHEMGACLLEKTAMHEDDNTGRLLLMLGKAQFELQKIVDNYRAHIIQTISTPSECLLRELQILEDMKQQCDEKRDMYKLMLTAPRAKGRSRNAKGLSITAQQLQIAQEQYEEEANLFVFRLKSLKLGQSRSLLTQAARHHAAQVNFFRKGLKSLELIEPHVKFVAEQHHIDYSFSQLEDDDSYHYGDGDLSYDSSDVGELSFDYRLNEKVDDVHYFHRNSTNLEQVDNKNLDVSSLETLEDKGLTDQEVFYFSQRSTSLSSQSAPISALNKFDFSKKVKEESPPSKKFHTYVLPTPLDVKSPTSSSTSISLSSAQLETNNHFPTQLWHSSPLITRHAFSGPITRNSPPRNSFFTPFAAFSSANQHKYSKASQTSFSTVLPSTTSPSTSSPRISELHELPRPPSSSAPLNDPINLVVYSAPLSTKGQETRTSGQVSPISSQTASPLPPPPPTVLRSFSIQYRNQLRPLRTHIGDPSEEVDSPPLTPLSLKAFHSDSPSLH
ncbi:hypothetical protein HPP92_021262 [Vanilla planifolia]|uniref:Hydroxyproline-rich glycoprotein family protein n=1 Tax=Vanilla planifolia TaxID=51239 RepID=A0A835PYD7_VANPL|nr:hypothetical protein HPP92_021262 [Vanilla planifolia]